MATIATSQTNSNQLGKLVHAFWQRTWHENKPLTLTGILMFVALGFTIVGIFVDPRVITGQPAWLKPAKFAISIGIYAFTLVWILSFIKGRSRIKQIVIWTAVATGWIEFIIIALQAFRGTTSHFNMTTPFDTAMFSIMGVAVMGLWLTTWTAGALMLFQKLEDRTFAWSLRIGLFVSVIGMGMAFAMTTPSPEQVEVLANNNFAGIAGAHAVGVDDGGAGLPILGWSTEGGDLRVAHFIGLHAMQALPLLAMVLAALGVADNRRFWLVISGGFAYTGITFLTFWQALRGQSVIAPDSLTLSVLAVIVLISAAGVVFAFSRQPHAQEA